MATQSSACETLLLLESIEDFQTQLPALIDTCALTLDILSESLDALLYNQTEICDAISRLARLHRNSAIRLMIKEPSSLVGSNHKLLLLQQRLPDKIKIKQLTIEPSHKFRSYVIGDKRAVLLQHQEYDYSGFHNSNGKPEARDLSNEFNELWQRHTVQIVELQRLGI